MCFLRTAFLLSFFFLFLYFGPPFSAQVSFNREPFFWFPFPNRQVGFLRLFSLSAVRLRFPPPRPFFLANFTHKPRLIPRYEFPATF